MAISSHPPHYIICSSSTDSSSARQGENKVSLSESLLAAQHWKNLRPDFHLLWTDRIVVEKQRCGNTVGAWLIIYWLYKTNVKSTVTVREQLELWVELFDYEQNFDYFISWLIYFLTSKYAAFSLKCCSTQWQSWRIQLHCVCIAAL